MRQCYDATLLADFPDESAWFQGELNGHGETDPLPAYQQAIQGALSIEPMDPLAALPGSAVKYVNDLTGLTNSAQDEPPRAIIRTVLGGIDWVLAGARDGHSYQEGDWIARPGLGAVGYSRTVARFQPAAFQRVAQQIEVTALETARRAEIALTYGDAVQDIRERYREGTESAIGKLGLQDRFVTIIDGIRSDNPEHWRAAMWACRSLLESLAASLWLDPNKTYPPITTDKGNHLSVTADKTVNRLIAYLHCKGVTGATREAIAAELALLTGSLHGLYGLDSKAHDADPVDRRDAELAVVLTYTLLAQLATRSNLQPVNDQAECRWLGDPPG